MFENCSNCTGHSSHLVLDIQSDYDQAYLSVLFRNGQFTVALNAEVPDVNAVQGFGMSSKI